MSRILTCTWAYTTMGRPQLVKGRDVRLHVGNPDLQGADLSELQLSRLRTAEGLGMDYFLIAQRWWGSGQEIEGSSYDCLAMTGLFAAHAKRIRLVTAIHPGFFLPSAIAKWGATIDRLTGGRWAINVTSGWHEAEFGMYGAELLEHDERYARSKEFIEVLQGAWEHDEFSYEGSFYQVAGLRLEPRPVRPRLEVFQGGQSPAAMDMAASHSDWMFLNGGPPEKIGGIIDAVRRRTAVTGRRVRFALNATPLCRATDAEAEAEVAGMIDAMDLSLLERRKVSVGGARGMWAAKDDKLAMLDTNEGFATRLIGTPETVLRRMGEFHKLGVDCFHLNIQDDMFNQEVLPVLPALEHDHAQHDYEGASVSALEESDR